MKRLGVALSLMITVAMAGVVLARWLGAGGGDERGEAAPSHPSQPNDKQPSEKPAGFWKRARADQEGSAPAREQREMIRQLEAIGYLTGSTKGSGKTGIARHDERRAQPGLSFYISGHMPGAVLMAMNGKRLHEWKKAFYDIWPDSDADGNNVNTQYWRRAHLFENGDVLVIFEGLGIAKLDRHSRVLWASDIKAHHDLQVATDGRIYVLTREAKLIPRIHKTKPVLEDFVTVLDKNGRVLQSVSLLESLEASDPYVELFRRSKKKRGDIFHTNTVHLLDGRLADRIPAFAAGNVLFSILMFSTIGVLDMSAKRVVWAHQGGFLRQHDPKVLPSGNLLLFNNHKGPKRSSVMELEPLSRRVVWEYEGNKQDPFYSATCGTAYRLRNGNTLVVESENGRAFEVTPNKAIVWEYASPHRAGDNGELVATLFDLIRLPEGFPADWTNGQ